jgi:hypothetical protein
VVTFTLRPLHFQRRTISAHQIKGWEGRRAGIDDAEKRKIPVPDGK